MEKLYQLMVVFVAIIHSLLISDIMKESIKPYIADDTNNYKTIVVFDCRGVEPVAFDPRVSPSLSLS